MTAHPRTRGGNGTPEPEPPFEPSDADAYPEDDWGNLFDFQPSEGQGVESQSFPEPENRGLAVLSDLGEVEYVEDIGRPGRIVTVAAEEGTGKSYATDDELAIRVGVAGGSFMGVWPVLKTGNVLVLSEMHQDDDYEREETTLASLGLTRADLDGRYFRLSLFTAANGAAALMDDGWRAYIIGWIREHQVILAVFDTGTAATNVDPWGKDMQQVFRNVKQILEAVPELLIVVVVHLKKPQGHGGERGLSAVLGEWGRWNDVTILMENDGASLERVKVTVRKRVRHERRFIVTKRGGLLVDPVDIETGATQKVPDAEVLDQIVAHPAMTASELGALLKVSKATAQRYVTKLEATKQVHHDELGPRGAHRYFAVVDEAEEDLLAQI